MITAAMVNKIVEEKVRDIERYTLNCIEEIDEKIEENAKRGMTKFSFVFYVPAESADTFKALISKYYTMLGFYGTISEKEDFIEVSLSSVKAREPDVQPTPEGETSEEE